MASANEIRSTFLNYFKRHGHEVVASSPLVPRNDPTLMFTNAGMVQFKNVFTGQEKRPYVRAATSQKCVRAGGKHNDLENVGHTARHHTFFEMLGNFSFGDYFKELAIELAWNLITKEYGLAADRLSVTVYSEDDQAASIWKKLTGFPDSRIIRIPTSDNFWAMGDTGPCGPCSEIFFDHGAHIPGGPPGSPDADGDRFVEIWNLVFMQFEQVTREQRVDLPKPSIDTGMGLERIAAVLQGKHDNYDIDLMRALIVASAEASGTDADGPHRISHRVIADHLRASSFLIADGVLPANEGRGYVLRRIMRRAMRHAHMIGATEPLMWKLVPALVGQMGTAFPELGRAQALIVETLKLEESRFKRTLDRGLKLLAEEAAKANPGGATGTLASTGETLTITKDMKPPTLWTLPGEVAFKLYDTSGFPVDLTADVLKSQGGVVDMAGFEQAMERQRAEARKKWAGSGEAATDRVWFELRDKVGASEFLGYDTEKAEGKVVALVVDGKPVDSASADSNGAGASVALIANQTPFYGESGGQMGDAGAIRSSGGARIQVTDTLKKLGDLVVHVGTVTAGTVKLGDDIELAVDGDRRTRLRANHSATHLLHQALRRRLGAHVTQKGSLVAPDRLRFDISHPKPLAPDDIRAVEADVNRRIRGNGAVETVLMSPDQAVDHGALALFGEKYGDEVRVVSMGEALAGEDAAKPYSTELCGGTHVRRTGDIGLFKIVGESAVAAGVRRIEALTGEAALDYVEAREKIVDSTADAFKVPPDGIVKRVVEILDDRKRLERELAETRKRLALAGSAGGGAGASEPQARQIAGIAYLGRALGDVPAKELKGMADELKQKLGSGVVALAASAEGKASIVVTVSDDLVGRVSAVDLVRAGAAALGGKGGGGRPDMAQAGGPDAGKLDAALGAIEAALAERAKAA